jgi:hypothetical protein
MRLDDARLCLDCEEIHEDQECPHCGSEAFAFLTRWVKPAATADGSRRREAATTPQSHSTRPAPSTEQLDAWRQIVEGKPPGRRGTAVTRSLLGLAAMGLAGWAFQRVGRNARKAAGDDADVKASRTDDAS